MHSECARLHLRDGGLSAELVRSFRLRHEAAAVRLLGWGAQDVESATVPRRGPGWGSGNPWKHAMGKPRSGAAAKFGPSRSP